MVAAIVIVLENILFVFLRPVAALITNVAFVAVVLIFALYDSRRSKKIRQLTETVTRINAGDYSLDIQDNSEDEISILKNEIYKTTIKLREAAENSQKDKVALKDSLADISHQLRTPLTSIGITVDNLLDDPEMDEGLRNEFLGDIRRDVYNINFMIETLLKLSKIDAAAINFVTEDIRIGDVIESACDNVSALADLREVDVKTGGDLDAVVKCDKTWQTEAVANIVKNCIEHTAEGGLVKVSAEDKAMYTEIKIEDNGSGIAPEDVGHVFERFYKGKNSSSSSYGIGLALSKSIVEAQGGFVSVTSEEGVGSVFKIKYMK